MNKHALKAHKSFNSHVEKKVIIGGETDFCAERFGYIKEKSGISPALTYEIMPAIGVLEGVQFAACLATGGKAVFASTDTTLYYWLCQPIVRPASAGNITKYYPSLHSTVIDGEYYGVLVSGNKYALVNPRKKTQIYTIPALLGSSVMHCGRLFGVDLDDEYLLKWSGYSLQDWNSGVDGAGYVKLNPGLGKILNLFVLGEKIVIVRERGITTIVTLGDSRHMRADVCDKYFLPTVYADSSVICGGKLWIYTQKGMYVFDGSSIAAAPSDGVTEGYLLSHARVADDRYVCYAASKGDERCLLIYDTQTGVGNPFGKDCYCPFFSDGKLYAFNGNNFGYLKPDAYDDTRAWVSKPFNFDEDRPAVLKSLAVEGSGNFRVETDCDGRKLYAAGAGKYRYAESAQSFTFKVTGNGSITSMTAEWEVR